MYIAFSKSYTTQHIGARVQKFRCKQVHSETKVAPQGYLQTAPANFEGKVKYEVFALQDITENGRKFAYPKDNSDYSVNKRRMYHETYGPYTEKRFLKIIGNMQTKMKNCQKTNQEKRFFTIVADAISILKEHIKCFRLCSTIADNLMLVLYAKTFEYEVEINNPKYLNDSIFPRQSKTARTRENLLNSIYDYRSLVDAFLATNTKLIYTLSPIVFLSYMENYGDYEKTSCGIRLARTGWLSTELGSIIKPLHQKNLKNKWLDLLSRFRPIEGELLKFICLPLEVCSIIAEYLSEVKQVGEPFADYMDRIYDNETRCVKTAHAHNCKVTRVRTEVDNIARNFIVTYNVEMMQFSERIQPDEEYNNTQTMLTC